MWTEILGALAIVAIVFVGQAILPAAPKLVDAVCDRIRHGARNPAETAGAEQTPAPAHVQQSMKSAATPTTKIPTPKSKPATPTQRAAA